MQLKATTDLTNFCYIPGDGVAYGRLVVGLVATLVLGLVLARKLAKSSQREADLVRRYMEEYRVGTSLEPGGSKPGCSEGVYSRCRDRHYCARHSGDLFWCISRQLAALGDHRFWILWGVPIDESGVARLSVSSTWHPYPHLYLHGFSAYHSCKNAAQPEASSAEHGVESSLHLRKTSIWSRIYLYIVYIYIYFALLV